MINAGYSIAASLVAGCCILGQGLAATPPWATPEVNSINRLPARAIAVPCESPTKALMIARGDIPRTESKWLKSLNGTWDFKWKHTVDAPYWEKEGTVKVPGCWQLQGDYDPPLYSNYTYPLRDDGTGNPMLEPPADYTSHWFRNPVGLYTLRFGVPAEWKGRRVAVHFGGVSSAMYVRVNGKEVGYSEDSRLPAEFDLTPFVEFGGAVSGSDAANTLEVEVLKHCDGTFLEDQDMWRLSGIFRDVWLVAERPESPKDLVVETALSDDCGEGVLTVRDENGKTVFEKRYEKPRLWSCETPHLYYEAIEMPGGDWRAVAVGFRKVEIGDSVIYINGRRALFMGVNRHEMDPEAGYAVTLDGMKKDIGIFHDLNINAVRTCHYPNNPDWYDLCDREGIYVVCEANIESHGAGYGEGTYAKKPAFEQTHVERGVNMVRTLRNHPSIVIWSLGNESGDGPNFAAEYKAIKELDQTRPVQYEQAKDGANTDIRCPMYMRPWNVEKYVTNSPAKPFVLCEYSMAMGNSNGDIQDYWDLVRKYPSMQGGFVWDFVDLAVWKEDERGRWLAYGGDFGDRPNDGNFNCNGLLDPTRECHPGVWEIKHVYRPIHVDAYDWEKGEATVYNVRRFLPLDDVDGWWTLDKSGRKVAEGRLDLTEFAPDSVKVLKAGVPESACPGDAWDAITFRFYGGDGREIAHDQFAKPFSPPKADGDMVQCDAVGFGMRLNFWRAPTDNDRGWNMDEVCKVWKDATACQSMPEGVASSVDVRRDAANPRCRHVEWKLAVPEGMPPIPRVGVTFTLPRGYTRVKWYGLGPWENYCDRATGALLGVYEAEVGLVRGFAGASGKIEYPANRLNPDNYSKPCEQGYRTGCRWVEFSNGKGNRIRITAVNAPFGFNAWPYSQLSLERAKHQWNLEDEGEITVNIDAAQMGVGGDNSWGARPHQEDMLGAGEYRLEFMIEELREVKD